MPTEKREEKSALKEERKKGKILKEKKRGRMGETLVSPRKLRIWGSRNEGRRGEERRGCSGSVEVVKG